MNPPFDYFVVLAEMRTGSNFLETNLNEFPGITCFGEAFNPNFIGYPNASDILGVTLDMRRKNPMSLVKNIVENTDGIGGFRLFHDHDQQVIEHCLSDARCAKIILSRNPVDSYVSLKIARETDQWKLTNHAKRKIARIRFDGPEFEEILAKQRAFRQEIQEKLQTSGQTAYHISYDDLQNLEMFNGLARYLGRNEMIAGLNTKIKKQNPASLAEKVENFGEMQEALAHSDFFQLAETPGYEPRRGPNAPSYIVAPESPLLYLPIRGRATERVKSWMQLLDGAGKPALQSGFTQKTLRQWKRQNTGHRSFTVISHPVARAHSAFCRHILPAGSGNYGEIRETLRKKFDVPIPAGTPGSDWNAAQHRAAFLAFLGFVKLNLSGKTWIRMDAAWATQASILHGINQFVSPDFVLRDDEIAAGIKILCASIGKNCPEIPREAPDAPITLSQIYDSEIESAARSAFQRDYMSFGFGPWSPES